MPADAGDGRWLEGRRVLVTGAAGGLGRALVVEADLRGATVAATGPPSEHRHGRVAGRRDQGGRGPARPRRLPRLVHEAAERLGGLDIVVNNAATLVCRPFNDLELDELEAAWEVNLRAPVLIMQESFPYLREAGRPPSSTSSRPQASTEASPR